MLRINQKIGTSRQKFLIFFSILLIEGCARKVPIIPYVPKEIGTIQGLVYESNGETPISGVIIWAYDRCGYITGYARTDIHGRYTIHDLFPGQYILQINSGEHYGTAGRYAGEYYKNAHRWEDAGLATVKVRESTSGINFLLGKGGAFQGKLIDSSKNLIPNTPFFLKAYTSKNSYVTHFSQTDSLGEYLLTGLEPGTYKIEIEPNGWIGGFYLGVEWDDAQTVESNFDTVNLSAFETTKGGAISGTVIPPAPGIMVQVIGKKKALEKLIDSSGYYIIGGLPEDEYLVKLSPQKDSPYAWKYYPDAISASQSTSISITTHDTITGIDFELTKEAVISGEVKNDLGNPVERFELELYTTEGEKLPKEASFHSPTGKYEINGIPPGEYILKISSFNNQEYKTYATQYYKSANSFKEATPIKVKSGYNTSGTDFKLKSAGWAQGFIYLNDKLISRENTRFKVIAFPIKTGPIAEGRNTFTGGYRISGLFPGEYKLCVVGANSEFAGVWVGGGRSFHDPKTDTVLIEKEKPANIDFSVTPGVGEIHGKVYDESTNGPISGEVFAYDSTGHIVQLAESSEDGYQLRGLPAGQYFIRTNKFAGYKDKWYINTDLQTPDCIDTAPWAVDISVGALSVEAKETEWTTGIDFYLKPAD